MCPAASGMPRVAAVRAARGTVIESPPKASRTTFAPDRRGHGLSSPYDGPPSFATDVSDLVGFSQFVAEELGERVDLVAHSAGCHGALAAAAVAPVSRFVLWEPPDFGAGRVSPVVWRGLETAAARGAAKPWCDSR